jgi:excisionase family DNA binding protein
VERLFRVKTAARKLQVSERYLRNLHRTGRLRVVRLGRAVRIPNREDLSDAMCEIGEGRDPIGPIEWRSALVRLARVERLNRTGGVGIRVWRRAGLVGNEISCSSPEATVPEPRGSAQ